MMDILRDANISNEEYLIKCKECIEANDVRFRIKNKINFVAKSVLKEQKGYNILRVGFNLKNENIILSNFINSIKYYSILYDEIVISVNTKDIEFIKNIFNYDPTIIITNDILYNDKIYYNKIFDFTNKNFSLNNIYTELNITEDIISKYFNNF
jgi:hypothetical protein